MKKGILDGIALPWDDENPPKFEDYLIPWDNWDKEENIVPKELIDNDSIEKKNRDKPADYHQ